jgi:thiamine-phosphate pyrophosphorylase
MKFPERGLYAITPSEELSAEQIIIAVRAAIKGGASVIQYRDKHRQDPAPLAIELLNICHCYKVPLIINDNIDLAKRIGADGVHLGKDDGNLIEARQRLGKEFIIGISCYNSLHRAIEAENNGATYVAFGRFFSSTSKPLASPADINTLRQAKQFLHIPIVAIGGILPENGGQLLQAGAELLAAIGGIFDLQPEQSARKYLPLFKNQPCK